MSKMNTGDKYILGLMVVLLVLSLAVVGQTAEEEPTELRGDEILLDDLNSQVEARGNVTFKRQGMTLEAGYLLADEALESLEAKGKVVATRANDRLEADRLDLDYAAEEAVFTGEAKFFSERLTVSGDKFNFDLKTNDLEVTGSAYLEDSQEGLTAKADELYYHHKEREVTMVGNVEIDRGDRKIKAPRVVIRLSD